jgi:hypothetical protein
VVKASALTAPCLQRNSKAAGRKVSSATIAGTGFSFSLIARHPFLSHLTESRRLPTTAASSLVAKAACPFYCFFFAALTCLFVAFMFQKHGRGVLDVANSAFVALCGCACTSLSCTLMGLHYYRMRDDGVGSHTSNFIGRAVLQAAQVALLLHAFRFSSSLSLQHVWSKLMQSRAAQYFTYAAAAAYAVVCICSLTADSSESIIASAQPVNSYGRALAAFQLAFAAFATHFYRRACRLEYADSSFKLKCLHCRTGFALAVGAPNWNAALSLMWRQRSARCCLRCSTVTDHRLLLRISFGFV